MDDINIRQPSEGDDMRYEWRFGPAVVTTIDSMDDVVIDINWQCVGYDDDTGKNFKSSGMIATPPVDPANFVPFDQITPDQVQSWVLAQVDQTQTEQSLLAESQVPPNVLPFNF